MGEHARFLDFRKRLKCDLKQHYNMHFAAIRREVSEKEDKAADFIDILMEICFNRPITTCVGSKNELARVNDGK